MHSRCRTGNRYSLTAVGLFMVLGTATGCGPGAGDSGPHESLPSTPSTSAANATVPRTFAELATHPCDALDETDRAGFVITAAGSVQPGAPGGCFWMTHTIGLSFYPRPSFDLTTPLPPAPGATEISVAGRRAVRIRESLPNGKEAGCTITVAVAADASFNIEVAIAGAGSSPAPAVDSCALGTDVATAVLAHLR